MRCGQKMKGCIVHQKQFHCVAEVPYYMSALGMQGARFIEGDPGGGINDPAPKEDPKPEAKAGEGEGAAKDLGGFKSQESKDAVLADLQKTREELQKFKDAQADAEKAKLDDIQRAQLEAQEAKDAAATAKAEAARYRIAAKHGISDDADLELLSSVTDDAAMEKLAARIAKPAGPSTPKPDMSGGAKNESTGTVDEQIAAAEKSGDHTRASVLKAQKLGELARNSK